MDLSGSLESIIFNLKEENIETSVQSTINLFANCLPCTFNFLVSSLIYSTFSSQLKNENLIFRYLITLNAQEEKITKNTTNVLQIFNRYLQESETQESLFLLQKMIEQKLLEPIQVKNIKTLYFAQYRTKEEISELKKKPSKPHFFEGFFSALEELSKDNWKLHKELIEEGHNPNELAKIIRNDDLEKLQEISSQSNFDFDQTIKPSLYEKYSFINKKNVTLIDYAAFFGSIKCFKYLILNEANAKNTLKYAVVSKNLEIIHLCEQNNSLFEDVYETTIKFHRNEIFKYFYDKNVGNQDKCDLPEEYLIHLGKKCLKFNNYELLSFIEQNGMKINEKIIEQVAANGNTFIMENIIGKYQIPKAILPYCVKSGNIEIVKLLLEQKKLILMQDIFVLIIYNLFEYNDIY